MWFVPPFAEKGDACKLLETEPTAKFGDDGFGRQGRPMRRIGRP
jgi:hypothetical protein